MSAILNTNKDERTRRTTTFPTNFNVKVDMTKVNLSVIKNWAANEIARILDNDDDVVPAMVFNTLETQRFPDIKALQITLSGFLDKECPAFCAQLWSLCISAQKSPQGVPKELLEAKKQELERERLEQEKATEEAARRRETERQHAREVDDLRQRDRASRHQHDHNEPRRSSGRGDYRRSRSPPSRYRRSPSYTRGRSASRPPSRYRRSPSYTRARSVSRSPSRYRRSQSYNRGRSMSRSPSRYSRSPSYDRGRSISHSPSPRRRKRRNTSSECEMDRKRARYSSGTQSRSPPRSQHRDLSPGSDDGRTPDRRVSSDDGRTPDQRVSSDPPSPSTSSQSRPPPSEYGFDKQRSLKDRTVQRRVRRAKVHRKFQCDPNRRSRKRSNTSSSSDSPRTARSGTPSDTLPPETLRDMKLESPAKDLMSQRGTGGDHRDTGRLSQENEEVAAANGQDEDRAN